MPNVPQRKLSYGEMLNRVRGEYAYGKRLKQRARPLCQPKPDNIKRLAKEARKEKHEYSYGNVMRHLNDIQNEQF